MASYTRRQILLKREDGAPAGFLRMERVDNRCDVEVQVDDKGAELSALLLDDEQVFSLGKISRNRTIHAPRIDEMNRYNRAAILSRDTLLFVGGEGADFANVRKALSSHERAEREKKAASTARERGERKQRDESPVWNPNQSETSRKEPLPFPDAAPPRNTTGAYSPAAPLQPTEGWVFTPCQMGALQYYAGHLLRGGRAVAKMHAVAGAYDPEPPPGLTGFVWDSGYWVKVAEGL